MALCGDARPHWEHRGFLCQCLAEMEPDPVQTGPGRPRVLPAMALWAGLLVCVLRGFGSQLALWRLRRTGGCGSSRALR